MKPKKVDDLVAEVEKLRLNSKTCDENILVATEILESMTKCAGAYNDMIGILAKHKENNFVFEDMFQEKRFIVMSEHARAMTLFFLCFRRHFRPSVKKR